MAVASELTVLHRAIDELNVVVGSVRGRYGDIPAVRRLLGDVDRILIDASELDAMAPPPPPPGQVEIQMIDDTPPTRFVIEARLLITTTGLTLSVMSDATAGIIQFGVFGLRRMQDCVDFPAHQKRNPSQIHPQHQDDDGC